MGTLKPGEEARGEEAAAAGRPLRGKNGGWSCLTYRSHRRSCFAASPQPSAVGRGGSGRHIANPSAATLLAHGTQATGGAWGTQGHSAPPLASDEWLGKKDECPTLVLAAEAAPAYETKTPARGTSGCARGVRRIRRRDRVGRGSGDAAATGGQTDPGEAEQREAGGLGHDVNLDSRRAVDLELGLAVELHVESQPVGFIDAGRDRCRIGREVEDQKADALAGREIEIGRIDESTRSVRIPLRRIDVDQCPVEDELTERSSSPRSKSFPPKWSRWSG